MVDTEALAALRDIQLPAPPGWWPLAFGWYVLLVAVLILSGLSILWGYKRYQRGRAKRQALALLAGYEKQYQSEGNSLETSIRLIELIRRVALVYFPREQVASLQGDAWIDFLNNSAKGVDFTSVRKAMLDLPYQPGKQTMDLQPLFACTKAWIRQRGRPCSS